MFEDLFFEHAIGYSSVWYTKQAFVLVRNGIVIYVKNISGITHILIEGEYICICTQISSSYYKYPQTRPTCGSNWDANILNDIYRIIEELLELEQFVLVNANDTQEVYDNWSRNLI